MYCLKSLKMTVLCVLNSRAVCGKIQADKIGSLGDRKRRLSIALLIHAGLCGGLVWGGVDQGSCFAATAKMSFSTQG